jgi:formylmethanofuran dehydrogenase subunit A
VQIKNGYVYDPLNEIKGEIMDIVIKVGKVVESFCSRTERYKGIDDSG